MYWLSEHWRGGGAWTKSGRILYGTWNWERERERETMTGAWQRHSPIKLMHLLSFFVSWNISLSLLLFPRRLPSPGTHATGVLLLMPGPKRNDKNARNDQEHLSSFYCHMWPVVSTNGDRVWNSDTCSDHGELRWWWQANIWHFAEMRMSHGKRGVYHECVCECGGSAESRTRKDE